VLILTAFPVAAGAEGSILIDYKDGPDGTVPVQGAVFTAYRIADIDDRGRYIYAEEFREGADAPELMKLAENAVRNGKDITVYTVSTDKQGQGAILHVDEGLYVVGETASPEGYILSAPFLVSIPFTEDGNWKYDAEVQPKPQPVATLTVQKTVRGRQGEKDREFHFRVTLDGYGGPVRWTKSDGTHGSMNGSCVITLKDGEKAVFHDIPEGCRYSVEEEEADSGGYITVSTGKTGVITKAEDSTALFINTSDVPDTGDNYEAVISGSISAAAFALAVVFLKKAGKKSRK